MIPNKRFRRTYLHGFEGMYDQTRAGGRDRGRKFEVHWVDAAKGKCLRGTQQRIGGQEPPCLGE